MPCGLAKKNLCDFSEWKILEYATKKCSEEWFVFFSKICTLECNTTSDWLNNTVKPIGICVAFLKMPLNMEKKSGEQDKRMFLRMDGE